MVDLRARVGKEAGHLLADEDGKKTLGLRGRGGKVRQSFSHGRTKNVVVETKRKRVVVPKANDQQLARVRNDGKRLSRYSKGRLKRSILRAAVTDVKYDDGLQMVIAVPFDDVGKFAQNLKQERRDLVEALSYQANEALKNYSNDTANINDEKLREKLEAYKNECVNERPNPRILLRQGNIIRDQLLDPNVRNALNSWDMATLDGFVSDHNELMRNHYSESLMRAQEVEAADVDEKQLDDASKSILEAADLIRRMSEEEGREIVDAQIPTILQDIAKEVEEYQSALQNPTLGEEQRKKLHIRYLEAVKNGAIFLGRFSFFFTAILVSTSSAAAFSAAGSLASILGVIEIAKPGSIYWLYGKLQRAIPLLPDIPKPRT